MSERSAEQGRVLLDKYQVESVLGRGGMGLVLKAWHLDLGTPVAIKILREDVAIDADTITRFVREAQAAVKLKSEHVARISDVGTFDGGKPYMVMEFLEGQDIGQMLKSTGALHPSFAIDLVIQTCDALAEAHALGIVHRDIKPTNLFVASRPDGTALLKVLDFGISKATMGQDLSLTQTSSMLGTPAYMSPEQMRSARRVDSRTDIWSLGSVLYEAIEGHLPFEAETFSEMCVMVAADPPSPFVATPPELQPVIARCLAKHPDQRYPSVAELAQDLAHLAREPGAAQILVDRMFRTLGRHAEPRSGVSKMVTTHNQQRSVAPPDTLGPAPRRSFRWVVIAIPLVAAVVVAIVFGSSGPSTHSRVETVGSGSSGSAIIPVATTTDARVEVDAAIAIDAESTDAADAPIDAAEHQDASPARPRPPHGGSGEKPLPVAIDAGIEMTVKIVPDAAPAAGSAKPCNPLDSLVACPH